MAHDQSDGHPLLKAFNDPAHVATYANGPRLFVPGLEAMHRMAGLLLAERAPETARVLVLGAGGGAELLAMAEACPHWRFVGVDPAREMLHLAERTLGPLAKRVELIEGVIDAAPEGPFDAAVCLLTLHFLNISERERTVREIHRRLRPDAPFVAAHASFPQGAERDVWLDRYAAYPVAMGADPEQVQKMRASVAANLHALSPEQDVAILQAGGFQSVETFYTAFVWRGWIALA
jgi:tRNA (cmo5U34)-methyltransferase